MMQHVIRQLLLRPALSLLVIGMLAIGIGSTTAIYSMSHQVLNEPLDVPEPERLVLLGAPGYKPGAVRSGLSVTNPEAVFSYPMFRDLLAAEETERVFTALAGHYDFLAQLAFGGEATGGEGTLVSGRYFEVLALQPALGRLIGPQDEPRVDESPVVVLSYDYWQSRFGGDPGVLDETLRINNHDFTIVGVAPEGFSGTMPGWDPSVFVPLTMRWLMQPEEARNEDDRSAYWLYLFARLRPGVSLEQAAAELGGFYGRTLRDVEAPLLTGLTAEQRQQFLGRPLTVEPGFRGQFYPNRGPGVAMLNLVFAATIAVLLIVCVNVANLLLARGASRAGEMAVRASIGASRGRLVRQLLAESAVLATLGGLASLPVALVTLRLIESVTPDAVAGLYTAKLSPPVMLFAAAVTVATVVLSGLAPAWQTSRTDPGRVMKGRAGQPSGGRDIARLRSVFTGAQITLATALVVLAGLFAQSLVNLNRVEIGMDVDSVVTFRVSPLLAGYSGERLDALYDAIAREVGAEPGVTAVGSTAMPVLLSFLLGGSVTVVGADAPPDNTFAQANHATSAGLFEALGIRRLAGRDFTAADSVGPPAVAVVNETFARRFGLGADAVGQYVRLEGAYLPESDVQIVGVVADARYAAVRGEVTPQFFLPRPRGDSTFSSQFFYVRGGIGADALLQAIPRAVGRVDPSLPVLDLRTMRDLVRQRISGERMVSILSASFALLATLLAAVGLYGVLAYNVARRTGELGLRLALGAEPRSLRRLVLRQITRIGIVGGLIGLAGAVAVGRVAQSFLYGLSGYDPFVLCAAVAVIATVLLAASYLPAQRAARVAPMEALRHE